VAEDQEEEWGGDFPTRERGDRICCLIEREKGSGRKKGLKDERRRT